MKNVLPIILITFVFCQSSFAKDAAKKTSENNLPRYKITQIIHDYAVKNNVQILVDPRVKSPVSLYGKKISEISQSELYAILNMHGFSMVQVDGLNLVMPLVNIKQTNTKINNGNKNDFSGSEIVTTFITVKNIPVSQLIPIIRPLVPQQGHIAAYNPTNKIILTDTYTNSNRIKEIVKFLDTETNVTFTIKCKDEK